MDTKTSQGKIADLAAPFFKVALTPAVRDRAYKICLSRTVSQFVLRQFGARFLDVWSLPKDDKPLYFLAVASSGYTLSSAIAGLVADKTEAARVFSSGIDPKRPITIADSWLAPLRHGHVVVIDNSALEGGTAIKVLELLRVYGIQPEYFVKLIQYDDQLEVQTTETLEQKYNIKVISLYTAHEIAEIFEIAIIDKTAG